MKTKFISLGLFAVFALVLMASFASATLSCAVISSPSTVSHGSASSITFNATSTAISGVVTLNFAGSTSVGTWTLPSSTTITENETKSFTATLNIPSYSSGTLSPSLTLTTNESESCPLLIPTITITSAPAITLSKVQEISASQNGVINVTNTGNTVLSSINLSYSGDFNATFSSNNFALAAGSSALVTIVPGVNISALNIGSNTLTVSASSSTASDSESFTINRHFCTAGEAGSDLEIRNIIFSNDNGEEDEWSPLDEITIEVEVKNTGNDKIRDVMVELGIFDEDGNNVADDFDWISEDEEQISFGSLSDGEKATVEFKFKVPADFDNLGDYTIAVKVYSDDEGEDAQCKDASDDLSDSFYQTVELAEEDDDGKIVIATDLSLSLVKATPGQKVTLTFSVFNVGGDDQDKVKVTVLSSDLNINTEKVINDLSSGDGEELIIPFIVPEIKDGKYDITIFTEYEYKSSTGAYKLQSDDEWTATLEVFGSAVTASSSTASGFVDVNVDFDENTDAVAGESLTLKASIKNTGNATDTFVITPKNFGDWAELDSVSPSYLTLRAGETQEVTIKFNVKDTASGEQTFTLETIRGSDISATPDSRVVTIDNIEAKSSFGSLFGSNWLIWVIIAVNVILIALIIIVAVSLSRR